MSDLFEFKAKYMGDMMKVGDYPSWDLSKTTRVLNTMIGEKRQEIITYRDHSYESAITGVVSSRYPKRWLDEFDDSLGNYVEQMKKVNS